MKRKMCLITLVVFALLVSSCSGPEQIETSDTVLRMAKSVDPDGLDPQRSVAESTFEVTSVLYDTLMEVEEDGSLAPGIAKTYSLSEDSLSLSFVIKEGLRFHNDRVVDAQAVKDSFLRLQEEASPRGKDYANFIQINVLSEYEVEFVLQEPDSQALNLFAYPWAAIVEASADNLRAKPVGSGAYKLVEWIPQQHIYLEAFDGSYRDAKIPRVEVLMIPDTSAQITSIEKGELDFIEIYAENIESIDTDKVNLLRFPRNGIQLMAMNSANPYLAQKEVREAIAHGINIPDIKEAVWKGVGISIGSHYPPGVKGYLDLTGKYPYDPARSEEILKDLDLYDKITLRMMLPKTYPEYVAVGQIIANQLEQVGFEVDQQIIEWASWLEDVYNNRDYDLTVVGHTGRLEPYALLAKYLSDGSENYFNYKNPELDELLHQALDEQEADKRTQLYQEMQEILAEEIPAIYLQTPEQIFVTSKNLQGFRQFPITIMNLRDLYFE
ncbi:MAG TPA: ABC transporter substrate-binding protein [Clostridia bacterium]|nr:ABC transporter substrate-binding protein [Clostridia bacterium]